MKNELSIIAVCFSFTAFAQADDLSWMQHTATTAVEVPASAEEPSFELVSFVATAHGGEGISLRWNTASEVPGTRFTVERSPDRMNWSAAIMQDGESDDRGYKAYEVMDVLPLDGLSYYRLIATGSDHDVLEVSDDFAVEYISTPLLQIQNDRDPGRFTVHGQGAISALQVLNNRGQFMPMDINYRGNDAWVNAEHLEPGTYFVQATVDGRPVLRTLILTATGVIGG